MKARLTMFATLLFLLLAANAPAATRYVDLNSPSPTPPFTSWAMAATNIQDAIDAASIGDQILVTNGVYRTGGRPKNGALTNRVVVDKAVTVKSVNGPGVTLIEGYQEPVTINGNTSVRCMYLTNGATLIGFTVTGGGTFAGGNDVEDGGDTSAGGILCTDAGAIVSNCVVVSNSAGDFGGGIHGGSAYNCLVINNSASGYGGGTMEGAVVNCTIAGNSSGIGSGDAFSTLKNCIVYDNDPQGGNYGFSTLNYCCTTPDPGGVGNITNAPLFVDELNGNFHLSSNSPCINAGNNVYVRSSTDLDGNPRIAGGTVDIGAYEFQTPASRISYAWLQQYNLAMDGSADFTDADGDGMNNWQEWICGTDPTDPLSVLKMLPTAPSDNPPGLIVTWQSVSSRTYTLQKSGDLGKQPAFVTTATNIAGQDGSTSFTDTNAIGAGPFFYRVKVE